MAIYTAPTWSNNGPPAINATRLQAISDALEQDGVEIQTLQNQQGSPFNFKGDVSAVSSLPSSGNTVNDTYYVTAVGALYTWNGSNWQQSSVSASDYSTWLAQIRANIAPTYSSSSTYEVGDFCLYSDQLYVCNTAITTAESWTAAHWTATSLGAKVTELRKSTILIDSNGYFYVED